MVFNRKCCQQQQQQLLEDSGRPTCLRQVDCQLHRKKTAFVFEQQIPRTIQADRELSNVKTVNKLNIYTSGHLYDLNSCLCTLRFATEIQTSLKKNRRGLRLSWRRLITEAQIENDKLFNFCWATPIKFRVSGHKSASRIIYRNRFGVPSSPKEARDLHEH